MSQCMRVLARLRSGPLTAYEAIRELSVGRLAARIGELRRKGHDIHTEQVDFVNVYGDSTHYGRYHLIKEAQ